MKNSRVRRINASTPMILLLLILTLLTIHKPASATVYTYTGQPFTSSSGPAFPTANGAIGDILTISFTYDGDIPEDTGGKPTWNGEGSGMYPVVSFTMTCGAVSIPGSYSHPNLPQLLIAMTAGLPSSWVIWIDGGGLGWTMMSENYYQPSPTIGGAGQWVIEDYVGFSPNTAGSARWNVGTPGVWTAAPDVPLPPSTLLLGSGLIPLMWARRKKRLGK